MSEKIIVFLLEETKFKVLSSFWTETIYREKCYRSTEKIRTTNFLLNGNWNSIKRIKTKNYKKINSYERPKKFKNTLYELYNSQGLVVEFSQKEILDLMVEVRNARTKEDIRHRRRSW